MAISIYCGKHEGNTSWGEIAKWSWSTGRSAIWQPLSLSVNLRCRPRSRVWETGDARRLHRSSPAVDCGGCLSLVTKWRTHIWYKLSSEATVPFRDHCDIASFKPKSLIQDVVTRWSSTANLLNYFIEIKQSKWWTRCWRRRNES